MKSIVNVLDHGYVRLVSHMGDDLSAVRAARASHDAVWRTGEDSGKDEKLINYLIKNRHTTPFEHVIFTFEVKAPIFVLRQWHRHRTWSFNEVSARYSELPEEFYVPDSGKIGTQDGSNHQSRNIDHIDTKKDTYEREIYLRNVMICSNKAAFCAYHNLLSKGVPRELARSVLPVATYSKMFATVDLHNLFHFLELRAHEHAQYEIRVYAESILHLIRPIVPVSVKAWKTYRGNNSTERYE